MDVSSVSYHMRIGHYKGCSKPIYCHIVFVLLFQKKKKKSPLIETVILRFS